MKRIRREEKYDKVAIKGTVRGDVKSDLISRLVFSLVDPLWSPPAPFSAERKKGTGVRYARDSRAWKFAEPRPEVLCARMFRGGESRFRHSVYIALNPTESR